MTLFQVYQARVSKFPQIISTLLPHNFTKLSTRLILFQGTQAACAETREFLELTLTAHENVFNRMHTSFVRGL